MANPNPSPATRWKKGQSGNPRGRTPTKPVTDALKRVLAEVAEGRQHTKAEEMARTLVRNACQGDVPAAKLVLSYVEGLPVQPVELRLRAVAERYAAELGCSAEDLIAEAERIAAEAAAR